ncbi:hypothetical protein NDU88_005705 [Pleurodeles waltl]|uniref:Uncharacterized protein n=1 Tax=Pleurodeles waltl TaxID=8319 RepID=A0AAV7WE47_PLEWA|nr:hypothetical protein NDU88_005705 [Pleurodeles waltl]
MHGSPPKTRSRVPCHLVGWRAKPRTGAPNPAPGGAPEPKLTGESSLGPVDSQVRAPQGTAGWRKGVPDPGPSRGSLNKATQGGASLVPVPGALPHGRPEDEA